MADRSTRPAPGADRTPACGRTPLPEPGTAEATVGCPTKAETQAFPLATGDRSLEGLPAELVGMTRAMLEQLLSLCALAVGSAGASPVVPIPAVLTAAEAAELLRVSRRTVSRMVADGRLVARRISGTQSARFLADDVLACLEEASVMPFGVAVRRPRVLTPLTRSRSIGRSRGITHGGGASFDQKLAAARRGDA